MFDSRFQTLAVRLGVKRSKIFGEDPPYPNPHGYPTNPAGVPLVPESDVKNAGLMGTKKVFSGGLIVSTSDDSFVVRREFGAPRMDEGDLFAFDSKRENGPALVFEVVEKGRGGDAYSVTTQDVGYLDQ